MIDPLEFLNNYTEWHYLWLGIFIGFVTGLTLGIWVRHRMRTFVRDDVLRSLVSLGVKPEALRSGARLDHQSISGVDTKLTIQTLASETEINGER